MGKLTADQQAFLRDNPFAGVATTLRPDGSPVTLTNSHADQAVGELVIAAPRDPQLSNGSLCVDNIAVAATAP